MGMCCSVGCMLCMKLVSNFANCHYKILASSNTFMRQFLTVGNRMIPLSYNLDISIELVTKITKDYKKN